MLNLKTDFKRCMMTFKIMLVKLLDVIITKLNFVVIVQKQLKNREIKCTYGYVMYDYIAIK